MELERENLTKQRASHLIDRIHTTPEKFESPALFLLLGLPSTLICHENGAFRKRSQFKPDRVNGKLYPKTHLLENDGVTIIT